MTMSKKRISEPPEIMGYRMDPSTPLHRLFVKRMKLGRDLKIIITAKDSETGVGKTTLGGWLGLTWNPMFAGEKWKAERNATLDPYEYFSMQSDLGIGNVLILDDAEELDARRSMQSENVEFSQRWMLMRVRQLVHILTLPSPKALDSRLEELADILIIIKRRGQGMVHDVRVGSYGSRKVMTAKVHEIEFPNVSDHPEIQRLDEMKEERIEDRLKKFEDDHSTPDPDEVERETKIDIAQKMRDRGMTTQEIANTIGMSQSWVSKETEARVEGVVND